jgi:hypothetical protein
MKRRDFIKSCAASAVLLAVSPRVPIADAAVVCNKKSRNTARFVSLKGAPYERGLQHGQSAKNSIRSILTLWDGMLQQKAGMNLAAFAEAFSQATQFESAIKEYTPELWQELQGIADGAGVSFKELYAYNLTDESQWFLRYQGLGLPLPAGRGCSSLAVVDTSKGLTVIAQNMDIPSGTEGFELLLKITDEREKLVQYVFTVAGMVGIIGLNSASVGVCNNSLTMLNQRKDGLPVNFVVRGLLDKKSFAEAKSFLYAIPHACGQNYVLGGPDAIGMYECSAAGVVEVKPENGQQQLLHTNHPLASKDINANPDFAQPSSTSDSYERLRSLRDHMTGSGGRYSIDVVKNALSATDDPKNPVCRPHDNADPGLNFTAASVIYELSTPPVMRFAPGPPCTTPFSTYKLGQATEMGVLVVAVALVAALSGDAHAYNGPGAGFAFLSSFFVLFLAFLMAIVSIALWPARYFFGGMRKKKAYSRSRANRVVIVGLAKSVY